MGSNRLENLCRFRVLLLILVLHTEVVWGKECTNTPPQLSSHSYRAALLASHNETWKKEVYSFWDQYHDALAGLQHLIPDEEDAWSSLLSRRALVSRQDQDSATDQSVQEYNWRSLYRNIKHGLKSHSDDKFLLELSLHNVRLDPESRHGRAQQTNLEYLLMLDVDNLAWNFRTTAGLPAPGRPYGGWESNTSELRGHFVGHYLSATAKLWASTHNLQLQEKMNSVVNALHQCQASMGTGYLSAFPSEFFDRFEAIEPVWAPYYTIHKIMTGLLDQYTYAGNDEAFNMTVWMADYFYKRVKNVIQKYTIERHWYSLNEETGGMNDVLYRLYTLSGDDKHLELAHLFDKPCFLGLLAVKADSISGFHANTHIPVVVGAQMRYEVTGDSLYKEIGTFFMDIVNSSHAYATGGTSVNEFWSDPGRLADTLGKENEESCTTYNMLKVARNLFRWTKAIEYADYYERALTNGVLSIQRGTEPGVMIYMLPQAPGASKARTYHGWGTTYDSFWCCYGTGIESFSKLGDSIYFEEEGTTASLYVIQFVSSTLEWTKAGLSLKQVVNGPSSWDPNMRVSIEFSNKNSQAEDSAINVRIPFWTRNPKAMLNEELPVEGNFLTIKRKWTSGDKLSFTFPVELRTEKISDDRPWVASIRAILFGPYLLAGMTNGEWDLITEKGSLLSEKIRSVPENHALQLFTFSQEIKIPSSASQSKNNTFVLSHSNGTIVMNSFPKEGTDEAAHSTFRIVDPEEDEKTKKPESIIDFVGKTVYLELFDRPGLVVAHQGIDKNVGVSLKADTNLRSEKWKCLGKHCQAVQAGGSSMFKVILGLDRNERSVSFESSDNPNCFLYGGTAYQGGEHVQLKCRTRKRRHLGFNAAAASFSADRGLSTYHPISFVAAGSNRHYLLSPLLSFRDESYTVYFNITEAAT